MALETRSWTLSLSSSDTCKYLTKHWLLQSPLACIWRIDAPSLKRKVAPPLLKEWPEYKLGLYPATPNSFFKLVVKVLYVMKLLDLKEKAGASGRHGTLVKSACR